MASLSEFDLAADAFCGLLTQATGDEPVPNCPGWSARDLAVHLGSVHRWAAAIVLSGQAIAKQPKPIVPAGALDEWYAQTADALSAALRAVDPTEPTPNFAGENQTAAFWPRRQAHETVVHTVDLAQALGRPLPEIDPELAADGVDEVLAVFFRRLAARGTAPVVTEPVRIEATDTGRVWVVAPGEAGSAPILLAEAASASALVAGTAADLYLGLWRRAPHDRLLVRGRAAERMLDGPTSV